MSILEPLTEEEKEIAAKLVQNLQRFYFGKSNAKMGHEIVSGLKAKGYTKFSGARLRKCVNWLRRKGYPICSDTNAGYWWPANANEVQECINSNKERADGILAANTGMEKGLQKYFVKVIADIK
jgi:biotin operon repressor